jgi:hypothetical protein
VGATANGAWRPHSEALFAHRDGAVPPDWTVVVAADRGLYAKGLFTTITALGWHPLLRINRQGQYCPVGSATFRPLSQVVTTGGASWKGQVTCFATPARHLTCTLLARWDTAYTDPWLILTDLPPAQADVAWYGMRAWIECSHKDLKRGGWHWEQTKMTHPATAATPVSRRWPLSDVAAPSNWYSRRRSGGSGGDSRPRPGCRGRSHPAKHRTTARAGP